MLLRPPLPAARRLLGDHRSARFGAAEKDAITGKAGGGGGSHDPNYDAQNVADARRGRDGSASVVELIKREFQGEMARALGKGGDKVSVAISDVIAAAATVDQAATGSAAKREAVAKYNALREQAAAARQELVIQREAAGMSGAGPATAMRVDVMRDAMASGAGGGQSVDDAVRKEYPLPPRLNKDGQPVRPRGVR